MNYELYVPAVEISKDYDGFINTDDNGNSYSDRNEYSECVPTGRWQLASLNEEQKLLIEVTYKKITTRTSFSSKEKEQWVVGEEEYNLFMSEDEIQLNIWYDINESGEVNE